MEKRFFKIKELCDYIGLGRTRAREWGEKHGAVRRIGKCVFYDRVIIDKVLDDMGKGESGND